MRRKEKRKELERRAWRELNLPGSIPGRDLWTGIFPGERSAWGASSAIQTEGGEVRNVGGTV